MSSFPQDPLHVPGIHGDLQKQGSIRLEPIPSTRTPLTRDVQSTNPPPKPHSLLHSLSFQPYSSPVTGSYTQPLATCAEHLRKARWGKDLVLCRNRCPFPLVPVPLPVTMSPLALPSPLLGCRHVCTWREWASSFPSTPPTPAKSSRRSFLAITTTRLGQP